MRLGGLLILVREGMSKGEGVGEKEILKEKKIVI